MFFPQPRPLLVWGWMDVFVQTIGGQRERGRAEGEESCEAKRLVT
ncbi:hypothetical protein F7725_016037 [Dissostichus mawsoni]|uniref:Uncharacterized protein n=1 Tax=Dissostichus mawsoni TaxID=36200 RepID=A0A7J5Y5C6_DISMA|nr:hypothetical protein F7725_016037 [Dissostichus mawsoni]